MFKIGFVQLGSFGDCINSTLMIEPIVNHFTNDYGHVELDVITTTFYRDAFVNCPNVNRIIAYEAKSKKAAFDLYNSIPASIANNKSYDKVFVPAPILLPNHRNSLKHPEFGNNLICTFMRALEEEGIDYKFPVKTQLRLGIDEINEVNKFINNIGFNTYNPRFILMEVHGESGQTYWNDNWTNKVLDYLTTDPNNIIFVSRRELTKNVKSFIDNGKNVIDASKLSLRCCGELFNRCDVFIGVSSGLTNICNTSWCKKNIQWFEAVNSPTVCSAPLRETDKNFFFDDDCDGFIRLLKSVG